MNNGQTMAMTMQMTPITGMSMMQMQPVQVQSVQMQMLPQMQILSQMQVMPESLQEVNQESQQTLPTDLQNVCLPNMNQRYWRMRKALRFI